jgi:DNA sulfur modification protein DndD
MIEMYINKIIIKNFRPYYGIQTFDFGDKPGLSIILGDNGVGKSSLIRALKYVLYDELDSQSQFKLKNELNIVAWSEGTFEFYVALDFDYEKQNYSLKRTTRAKSYVSGDPKNDSDFESSVTLVENGLILSPEKTSSVLKKIIPKKISEYILFEGETINKYKDLLDNNKNQEIYESIRRILGVTLLENAEKDLESQLEKYNIEKTKLMKDLDKNNKLLKEISAVDELISNLEETLKNDEKKMFNLDQDVNRLQSLLQQNQRISDLLLTRKNLSIGIKNTEDLMLENKLKYKNALKDYKSICANAINSIGDEMPVEVKKLTESKNNNKLIIEQIEILRKNLLNSECDLCGHSISDIEKSNINLRIGELTNRLVKISDEQNNLINFYFSRQDVLDKLISQTNEKYFIQKIKELDLIIHTSLIKLDSLREEQKSVLNQIQEIGGAENIEEVAKAFGNNLSELNIVKERIKTTRKDLEDQKNKKTQIVNKNPISIDTTQVDKKIKNTIILRDLFKNSIKLYSDLMRTKVQSDATSMFTKISENTDYKSLEFDEQYGLKLRDSKDREVPNVSSGYMTLITISLIYGLHKNSSLTGTIILDAPFSVLTNFHRDRIINTFKDLSPQVILLVYKDQINIQDIREKMKDRLVKEIEIFQDKKTVDSLYKTIIREVY